MSNIWILQIFIPTVKVIAYLNNIERKCLFSAPKLYLENFITNQWENGSYLPLLLKSLGTLCPNEGNYITNDKENMIMMNETVKKVMNEQEVTTRELVELVNEYDVTMLVLKEKNCSVFNMQVNRFSECCDHYCFYQSCGDCEYGVRTSDVLFNTSKYYEDSDSIVVTIQLKNDRVLELVIFHVSEDCKNVVTDGFQDVSPYDLLEFISLLDDNKNRLLMTTVKNAFGLEWTMHSGTAYMEEHEYEFLLHISNGETTFDVTVYDDGCNEIFAKKSDIKVEYIIRPYGNPFTEIKLLFSRMG